MRMRRSMIGGLLLAGCSAGDVSGPPVPGALRYDAVTAGYTHTCALTTAGRAYCWGGNAFGTLGDGTRTDRTQPVPVSTGTTFQLLDAGAAHTCGLSNGDAWCWGQNDEGQLGNGTFTARDEPVRVAAPQDFFAISAGHAHTCALTHTGQAWCWGDNSAGQLGSGTIGGKSASPLQVTGGLRFIDVHAGYYQTCALDTDRRAWCWGLGDDGQHGDGGHTTRAAPGRVSGDLRFSDLSAGDRFVCGVSDGLTYCWGAARAGELGTLSPSASPVRVSGLDEVDAVAASMGASTFSVQPFACAVAFTEPRCWGGTVRGGLLPGGVTPAPLAGAPPASALATGGDHVCVLDLNGYAHCGGGNYAGQLGDNSRTNRATLVPVSRPLR